MSKGFSSIEDLMQSEQEGEEQAAPQSELQSKMSEIREKRLEAEVATKAASNGLLYTDLHGFPILSDALKLIDKETALEVRVVCFLYAGNQIRIGFVDIDKHQQVQQIADDLQTKKQAHVELYLISESSFQTALAYYDLLPKKIEFKGGVAITAEDIEKYQAEIRDVKDLGSKIQQVSLSEVIVIILASALKMDASDVHIEAAEKNVITRFRIDGVLHDIAEIPNTEWDKLISRLKLVAKLKLNVTNRPQDGRFSIHLSNDQVEVRVSTIPTSYGESVVMRLLRASSVGLHFDDLGITGIAYENLLTQVKRPNGMIISTGPTGSGKTTTLYSILNLINTPETKIITLEDPIEYKLEGINQSQIGSNKEYTFAKGLRSILRQDPDVIMVGEIRDDETADISINAALTGHLVISTLHTNSAAGAIPRFLAMNAKPFLLAPALNAVVGQRLVRRLCSECKAEHKPTSDEQSKVTELLRDLPENSKENQSLDVNNLTFYTGGGCDACHGLGYKGRIGIYEILMVTPTIESMILGEKISEYDIEKTAKAEGMITMAQDGVLKALDGITSLEEVFTRAE